MIDPILIMAMPRSGSSMTAGLFAKHGVWTGNVRPGQGRNPKGFFESIAVREIIREHSGRLVKHGTPAERRPGFRAKIEQAFAKEGYPGGPWLWKGSAMYWPSWYEWPNPKWVVCRRDIEASIESLRRPPYALHTRDPEILRYLLECHHRELDILIEEHGAFEVDTQAVALGDFTTIKAAIEGCGLIFSEEITDEFVERSQWHHVATSDESRAAGE